MPTTPGSCPLPRCTGGRLPSLLSIALWLVLLGTSLASASSAQEPRVSLTLDPKGPIGLEEYLRLTVTVEGPRSQTGRPTFRLDNLKVVSGPSQNTSIQFINGVSSQSVSFTWIVQAEKLGPARVHSGTVRLGERVVELPNQAAEVVENPPERRQAGRTRDPNDPFRNRMGRDPFESLFDSPLSGRRRPRPREPVRPPQIFLEAEVSPARPYVGQQVLYTLYLYTDVTVRSVTPTGLPDFKGFWAQVIPQPQEPEQEWVVRDNREIGRIILLQRALFPRRAGELEIEPVEAAMTAMVRDSSSFGSFFPQLRKIERDSNAVTVRVRELPQPAPEGFRDAIGRIGLEATLEPRELEAGQAATLTLELEGDGHLQGLLAPDLPEIPDAEVFPPQQQSEETLRGTTVRGSRVWSYVVVPQKPGSITIEPIRIPYFDPERGSYRVAETESLTLEVSGSTRSTREAGSEVELHGIRTATLPSMEGSGAGFSAWRHVLVWAPLLATLAMLYRRREQVEGRPTGSGAVGQRSGQRAARRHLLHSLREAAGEERPRQVAKQVEDAWRTYLVERWEISPGTASTQWSALLETKGISKAIAEDLVRLAEDLHYLRYAPKLSSTDELRRELVERSQRLAKKI